MKRMFTSTVLSLLLISFASFGAPDAHATDNVAPVHASLTDAERGKLVEMLEQSQAETEALVAEATGEKWEAKPEEDRWSVAEVVEHLAIVEEELFGVASDALTGEVDPEWETTATQGIDGLVTMVQDRTQKFQAPEGMQPQGGSTREALIARYEAARAKTLAFVKDTDAPVKKHTADGPPGKMNVHQWLALIGAHNLRHNKQIEDALGAASD